jgi:predicted component of type VI protein secretion system
MRLVIEDEAGTRTVVPFSSDEIVVGRATDGVAWRLPDRDVSRRHARFTHVSGTIFVEDLGSLTGTWLNGERIDSRRRVRPGDLVEIGAFDLVVLPEDMAVAGPGAPPPLPASTRPDPMPAVVVPAAPGPASAGPATTAAVATATGSLPSSGAGAAVARADSARSARLLRLGVAALVGGVLVGFLIRRLVT